MKIMSRQRSALLLALGFFAVLASGCVVPSGYTSGVGVEETGYYEPYGTYYGGWSPGYQVAPYRQYGHDYYERHDDHPRVTHAYRQAPALRATPTIPTRGRSGGEDHGHDRDGQDHDRRH